MSRMLRNDEVNIAFVCGAPYVLDHDSFCYIKLINRRAKVMLKNSILLIVACMAVLMITSPAFADAKKGEEIFKNKKMGNCKTCHKLGAKKKVGPGLKGMFDLHSEDWIRMWLKDPQGTWTANDSETQEMKKRLRKENKTKTLMKMPKGGLTDEQISDLIEFLKGATK